MAEPRDPDEAVGDVPAADATDHTPEGDGEPGPEVASHADEERPVDAVTGGERRSDMDVAFDWRPEHR